MANKQRGLKVRQDYVVRFTKKYKMNRQEWVELKKTDPQRAYNLRMRT